MWKNLQTGSLRNGGNTMAEKLHKYVFNDEEVELISVALNHYLATTRRDYRAGAVDGDDYDYTVDAVFDLAGKMKIKLDLE